MLRGGIAVGRVRRHNCCWRLPHVCDELVQAGRRVSAQLHIARQHIACEEWACNHIAANKTATTGWLDTQS